MLRIWSGMTVRGFTSRTHYPILTFLSSVIVSKVVAHDTNSAAGMTLKTELKQVRAVLSISVACFSSECAPATVEIWSSSGRMPLVRPSIDGFVCRRA